MLVGGVMTAALAMPNANPFGADNMFGYMNGKQIAWLSGAGLHFPLLQSRLGLLALPLQCGNRLVAHPGHPHADYRDRRSGVVGIIVAAGNVWAFFIQWLTLLGILVPPIGAIILVDQYLLRPNSESTQRLARRPPSSPGRSARWLRSLSSEYAPEYSTAIAAFIVAGVVMACIA